MNPGSNKLVYTLIAVIVILLVTSGIGLVNYQEQRELDQARLRQAIGDSEKANQAALQREMEADRLASVAEIQKQAAIRAKAEATAARHDAEEKRLVAAAAMKQAELAEARAQASEAMALEQKRIAEQESEKSRIARNREIRMRYLAQGKAMAVKSLGLGEHPEQEALIALQAYKFNVDNKGNPADDEIYNGLYYALAGNKDPIIQDLSGLTPSTKGDTKAMADALCKYVQRNMTREEWNTFVGDDLPYESTCDRLPANNK